MTTNPQRAHARQPQGSFITFVKNTAQVMLSPKTTISPSSKQGTYNVHHNK